MSAIQRMIDQMRHRGYATKTIQEYSGSLRRLATYFGCCPSQLTLEQLREYQVHFARRKDISWSYYNSTVPRDLPKHENSPILTLAFVSSEMRSISDSLAACV